MLCYRSLQLKFEAKLKLESQGGHFKSDIAVNQWAAVYGHNQQNSKANLMYALEIAYRRRIQYDHLPALLGGAILIILYFHWRFFQMVQLTLFL